MNTSHPWIHSEITPLWLASPCISRRVCLVACLFAMLSQGTGSENRGRILLLGDSLAAGYGVEREEGFPALIQKRLDSQKLPFQLVNAGVSGDTSAGGLRRIDWLLKSRVDILFLELGGNDGLRGIDPAATKQNLTQIIEKTRAKYPTVRILVAGMQMPPSMGARYAEHFAAIFPELAKKKSAVLIPFLLEGVGGNPKLNLPDLIHPTPEGHQKIAETVWKHLEPLLEPDTKASKVSGTPSGKHR